MKVPTWLKDTRGKGILAAAGIVLVFVLYVLSHHVAEAPILPSQLHISSTTALMAGTQATNEIAAATASSAASSTPATKTKASTSSKAPLDSAPITAAQSTEAPAQELDASGGALLKSLVNIVCLSSDPSIPSISGSGVIIDSRGIILTAAHVAQLFLLQDYLGTSKVECIVRDGSPARRAYLAEPIYVSPSWIKENPATLTTSSPLGTGQDDFALLGITATATSTPLPNSYPAIPLAPGDPQLQQQIAIGSYGAQYLTSSEINYSLYPILVFGSIQSRYTFGTNTVDLVSVVGSAASQEGSSGGGIVDAAGQLLGAITTSTVAGNLQTRSLNAITVGHMRRSYTADTGQNLDSTLQSESVPALIAGFANESKNLGAQLVQDIQSGGK
jgi:hypothetical protein